jgi:hypothetical protein
MKINFSCEYCFRVIVIYALFPVKNFDCRSIVLSYYASFCVKYHALNKIQNEQ